MKIKFYKYQATGNDFILIDDRKEDFNLQDNKLIQFLCSRRFGVGSDGLILLRNHKTHDFEMIFFNSTGEKSTFCGNGARCIVSFAHYLGIFSRSTKFIAYDGEHTARIDNHNVQIKMQDIKDINVYVNKLIFAYLILTSIIITPALFQEYYDPLIIILFFLFFKNELIINFRNSLLLFFYFTFFLISANFYY